jgi:hypothetical protein
MVLNWLFENLLSCINLTNNYYPKKFDNLPGTQKILILMTYVVPKFSKNNLPNNFSYN